MLSIDMPSAYRAFKQYVMEYDPSDPKIALKITHIVRVAKKSRELAQRLGLDEENIVLAELIGLLHDIGRFEQVTQYNTFKDSDSINHGLLGCQILFGMNGNIRSFSTDNRYDEIIYTAVINHNRAVIEEAYNMREIELLHSKIIRDTDKLDIFRVHVKEPNIAVFAHDDISEDILSPAVYEDFCQEKLVDYRLRSGSAPDSLLCSLAYVYDINFSESHAIALEDGHLMKIREIEFKDPYTSEKFVDACDRSIDYCKRNSASKEYCDESA